MVSMLVGGGPKYNKDKRKHKKKKKKRQKKKKKEKKKATKKDVDTTDRRKRENRWRPLKYKEDKTKVPLVVFGGRTF